MEMLMGTHEHSRSGLSRSPLLHLYNHHESYDYSDVNRLSGSLYSQTTGNVRSRPEPRQPVKLDPLSSRFSTTTLGSSVPKRPNVVKRQLLPSKLLTTAESYAASVRQSQNLTHRIGSHLQIRADLATSSI
ncbi:hypothetical protein BDR07DRAFT_1443248, partial [Suillus spraguei]